MNVGKVFVSFLGASCASRKDIGPSSVAVRVGVVIVRPSIIL